MSYGRVQWFYPVTALKGSITVLKNYVMVHYGVKAFNHHFMIVVKILNDLHLICSKFP